MGYILGLLSILLGYLMNVFYLFLDLIGTPYIWLCIVLFSFTTRFIFLPTKIRSARKNKLKQVIDAEVADIQYRYLLSEETKEIKKQKSREIKAVYKKYRVPQGSGCLTALLQLPIYIALYNVVVSPSIYVPAIEQLYTDSAANADIIAAIHNLGVFNIGLSPIALGFTAYIFPLWICFFTVYKSRKAFAGLKVGPKPSNSKQKLLHWYTLALLALQVVVMTGFSFKLPLGISIYWMTNDVVNILMDHFVTKSINKNKKIDEILACYSAKSSSNQSTNEEALAEAVSDSGEHYNVLEGSENITCDENSSGEN